MDIGKYSLLLEDAPEPSQEAVDLAKSRRTKAAEVLKTEPQLPPHSIEAEQGVLGCIMLSPPDSMAVCIEKLKSGPEAFYDLRHRAIYEVLLGLYNASAYIDLIVVQQKLKDQGQLEGIGGLSYLSSLPDATPSAANIEYYIEIVEEKSTLRSIITTCTETASKAHGFSGDSETLLNEIERSLSATTSRRKSSESLVSSTEAVIRFGNDMDDRIRRQGTPSGIITGFNDLDDLTDGLQLGEQFVIGARPSIGKTALGLNIFSRACLNNGIPSMFISIEQSTRALMRRLAGAYCHINGRHLKRGTLTDAEMASLHDFNIKYRNSPAIIYDFVSSGVTAQTIASIVKREAARSGVKLVVVDYLQKVTPVGKHEKRTYEVADISGILRAAAVESDVAMVTLAQLNRENEKEKGRPPRITDLADSGQIERDADMVGLLNRDRASSVGPATLAIAKQRDGETGIVNLHFDGRYCEFTNGTRPQYQEEE